MSRGWLAFLAGAGSGAAATALAFSLLPGPAVFAPEPPRAKTSRVPPHAIAPCAPAAVPTAAPPAPMQPRALEPKQARSAGAPIASATPNATPERQDLDGLDVQRDDEWDALVGGMLEYEVERRLGRQLAPQQKQRLMDRLGELRQTSSDLSGEPGDPHTPEALRERLSRSLALLQVDRAFREELGIGAAEFLQGLDPQAVEDVAAPRGDR